MKAGKGQPSYRKPSGAELRALREQRAAGPTSEAARREASFLRNIAGAGDDLEWILLNQAWTQLDFERVGDWWEQRVLPVLDKLDLRPSATLAERVIAAIQADEATLPKLQRRTQREIASIARTSQSKVSRSLPDAPASDSDLEKAAAADASQPEPAPADIPAALREAIAETAQSIGAGVVVSIVPNQDVLCPVGVEHGECQVCHEEMRSVDTQGGYLRCRPCDPRQEHIAEPTLDGQWGDCRLCVVRHAQEPAAVTAESPTEPAANGLGGEPVDPDQAAGSAGTETAAGPEVEDSPSPAVGPLGAANAERPGVPAVGAVGTPTPGGGETKGVAVRGNPQEPAFPTGGGIDGRRLNEVPAGAAAPVSVGQPEERIEEEAVEPRERIPLPVYCHDCKSIDERCEQHQDSPIGRDHIEARTPEIAVATTGRSGEDHHLSGGVAREDAGPSLAEPELEDGGTPIPPSSSDPASIVGAYRQFADLMDHVVDHDVLAPLVTDAELAELHVLAGRLVFHVTEIERWRTK